MFHILSPCKSSHRGHYFQAGLFAKGDGLSCSWRTTLQLINSGGDILSAFRSKWLYTLVFSLLLSSSLFYCPFLHLHQKTTLALVKNSAKVLGYNAGTVQPSWPQMSNFSYARVTVIFKQASSMLLIGECRPTAVTELCATWLVKILVPHARYYVQLPQEENGWMLFQWEEHWGPEW